jgi:hypothetical protein
MMDAALAKILTYWSDVKKEVANMEVAFYW